MFWRKKVSGDSSLPEGAADKSISLKSTFTYTPRIPALDDATRRAIIAEIEADLLEASCSLYRDHPLLAVQRIVRKYAYLTPIVFGFPVDSPKP